MSKTVDDIRKQIDSLDNKIHDLLIKRADMVLKIGEEKRKNNIQVVQPDREAIMLRRLLSRHTGPLPKEAIVRIWRELVGAVSLLQTGLKVVVTVPEDHTGLIYWDMAKDYFSSVLPMQKVSNPLAAMAMVREGDVTFGVMPWPEDNEKNPWWSYLMQENTDGGMRIVGRLPFGNRQAGEMAPEYRGLVIGRINYQPSEDDCSFIALELDKHISRGRIVEKTNELGLEALSLYTCPIDDARTFHLIEVNSYISVDDDITRQLIEALEDYNAKCVCLGGYPQPPVYEDKVGKGVEAEKVEIKSKRLA